MHAFVFAIISKNNDSVPNVEASVCAGETTVIFVLDNATPGVPHPNELTVTAVVAQGVTATRERRRAIGALDMISGTTEVVVVEEEAADTGSCRVGPLGKTVEYAGGTYVGPYRCTFEAEDSRGLIVLSDLDLDMRVCDGAPDTGDMPDAGAEWSDDGHESGDAPPDP